MNLYHKSSDYFSSFDLSLVSALVCLGYPVDYLDKSNPRKVEFFLVRQQGMDEAIQGFWSGALQLPALAYFNSIKNLKNRIYGEE